MITGALAEHHGLRNSIQTLISSIPSDEWSYQNVIGEYWGADETGDLTGTNVHSGEHWCSGEALKL
jgi:hypothetical protein